MRRDNPHRVVVVGGGVAAQRCALTLRKLGFAGSIAMISSESTPPYDRTMLSKNMLASTVPEVAVELCPGGTYEDMEIELRLGVSAVGLDPRCDQLHLSDGGRLAYDRLVICSGGRPSLPPSLSFPGALSLRELSDLRRLRAEVESCRHLAIIGGGFIGGEVASSLSARGVATTIVEAAPEPLAPVLGTEVGARIRTLHQESGVELVCGVPALGVEKTGASFAVRLANERAISADRVLVAVGMKPAISWLARTPLQIDGGILTDEYCCAVDDKVFAAGDCARWYNPRYGGLMRVEHWETAAKHGEAVASSVMGVREPFAPIPFFWSDQHGVKFQWVGYAPRWDTVHVEDVDGTRSFIARYYFDGENVGVFAANSQRVVAAAYREMRSRESRE